jgi:hypothetical protein
MTETIDQLKKLLTDKNGSEPKYNNEFIYEYTGTMDNEKFATYKNNSEILVSNYGRIKYKGEIIKQKKDGKYFFVNIPVLNAKEDGKIYVHKMVAETFCEEDKPDNEFFIVHHKSGNSFDNRAENLIYVACSEHVLIHNCYPPICYESQEYWKKVKPEYCEKCEIKYKLSDEI